MCVFNNFIVIFRTFSQIALFFGQTRTMPVILAININKKYLSDKVTSKKMEIKHTELRKNLIPFNSLFKVFDLD